MSKRRKKAESETVDASAQFVPGYQDITWLAGKVFIDRHFMDEIEEQGFDTVFDECPYGDLTPDQRVVFVEAFGRWELRMLVRIWWVVYDHLRKHSKIGQLVTWRP